MDTKIKGHRKQSPLARLAAIQNWERLRLKGALSAISNAQYRMRLPPNSRLRAKLGLTEDFLIGAMDLLKDQHRTEREKLRSTIPQLPQNPVKEN